ncbi:MAG: rhomboid family intramembrane serine protease [Bacteroidota bacterium]
MHDLDLFLAAPVATFLFIITLITSIMAFKDQNLMDKFILNPYDTYHYKKYHTLLTSGLIHGNTIHLAFNMLTFYFFAFYLEAYFLGSWQFAVLYIVSLVLSDIPTLFKHKDSPQYYSLGASGAISAVVLSIVMCKPDLTLRLFFAIPIPGWLFALAYIGYSYYASRNSRDNINHDAHLWGALAGIVLTLLLKPTVLIGLQRFIGM